MLQSHITQRLASVAARASAFVLLAGLVLVAPAVRPQTTAALGQIVEQQNISVSGDQSEIPQIDYNIGRLAAVWGERGHDEIGVNTTSLGSAWPNPLPLGTGSDTRYQNADVEIDAAGTTHIVYAAGNSVAHRAKLPTGTFTGVSVVASSDFPNSVRMAQAPNGTLWVVWRGSGSSVFYKFSNDGGVSWHNGSDGGVVASESGNMFAPDIAVDQDNNPHVVWYLREGGSHKGDVRYADWTGSSFVRSSLTTDGSGLYDADASITVDGQNVQHVVWRKSVGSDWQIFYAFRVPGGGWAGYTPIAATNGDAKYAPAIGTDKVGDVYITYSDPISGSARRILFLSKRIGGDWEGPIALSGGRWDSRSGVVGSNGPEGIYAHAVHQHEQGTDDGETIYSRILIQSCSAQVSAAGANQANAANPVAPVAGAGKKLYLPFASKPLVIPGCS